VGPEPSPADVPRSVMDLKVFAHEDAAAGSCGPDREWRSYRAAGSGSRSEARRLTSAVAQNKRDPVAVRREAITLAAVVADMESPRGVRRLSSRARAKRSANNGLGALRGSSAAENDTSACPGGSSWRSGTRQGPASMVDGWSTSPRFEQNRTDPVSRRFLPDSRHFAALSRGLRRAWRPLFRIMSPLRRLRLIADFALCCGFGVPGAAVACRRSRGIRWPQGGPERPRSCCPRHRGPEPSSTSWMYTRHAEGRGFESRHRFGS
jgi:hypothetical protein